MGRLVRRFIKCHSLTIGKGTVTLGGEEASATPSSSAAYVTITHTNKQALTSGRLCAMSVNLNPLDAVDAYSVYGMEVCTYLASSVVVSGSVRGLFVETQGGGTLSGDFYSLYVYSAPGANPAGTSHVMRLESNPSTITWVDSFIHFAGNPNYLFYTSGQGTSDSVTGDVTGTTSAGWLKVNEGGSTKYIALYNGPPA